MQKKHQQFRNLRIMVSAKTAQMGTSPQSIADVLIIKVVTPFFLCAQVALIPFTDTGHVFFLGNNV